MDIGKQSYIVVEVGKFKNPLIYFSGFFYDRRLIIKK